jgi:hypothetical protein
VRVYGRRIREARRKSTQKISIRGIFSKESALFEKEEIFLVAEIFSIRNKRA